MKCDEDTPGTMDIADQKSEELCTVLCTVRDLPHMLADSSRREQPAQHHRRLKYNALLLHPHEAEEQQVNNDGGERDEQNQH